MNTFANCRLVFRNIDTPGGQVFTKEDILRDYQIAVRARKTSEKEIALQRQGRAKFAIVDAGHELVEIAEARQLQDGKTNWRAGYYRNAADDLWLETITVQQLIAQVLGDTQNDPASQGRMMGRHPGTRLYGPNGELIDHTGKPVRSSDVSSTASQMPRALGLAAASKLLGQKPEIAEQYPQLAAQGDGIAHVAIGDGSTAEGQFLESVVQAAAQGVPLAVSIRDNKIAITGRNGLPFQNISRVLSGLTDEHNGSPLMMSEGPVEGWDYPAIMDAHKKVFDWVKGERKPGMIHSYVTQPFGHSTSSDAARVFTPEEKVWHENNDCIKQMRLFILQTGIATEAELMDIEEGEKAYVNEASQSAWIAYIEPKKALGKAALQFLSEFNNSLDGEGSVLTATIAQVEQSVTSENITLGAILDALSKVLMHYTGKAMNPNARTALENIKKMMMYLEHKGNAAYNTNLYAEGEGSVAKVPRVPIEYKKDDEGKPVKDKSAFISAAKINSLAQKDPRIVYFGEDVAGLGGVALETIGVFGGKNALLANSVTKKLLESSPVLQQYLTEDGLGSNTIYDHAIAEISIIGTAVGMALRGLKPIVEIQYIDYFVYGLQQIVDELACLRYRTASGQVSPVTIITRGGRQEGMWHAGQPLGMIMTGALGLRIAVPRNAAQQAALMQAHMQAIDHGQGDPALFVSPLKTLRADEDVPANLETACEPWGNSEVLRAGEHVTIVTYGYCCRLAMEAAEQLEQQGVSVSVVDLQTLSPLDVNGVALAEMRKTEHVLFFDEDGPDGAMALVQTELNLRRGGQWMAESDILTAAAHKTAYSTDGEEASKPQTRDVVYKVLEMLHATNARDAKTGKILVPELPYGSIKNADPGTYSADVAAAVAEVAKLLEVK